MQTSLFPPVCVSVCPHVCKCICMKAWGWYPVSSLITFHLHWNRVSELYSASLASQLVLRIPCLCLWNDPRITGKSACPPSINLHNVDPNPVLTLAPLSHLQSPVSDRNLLPKCIKEYNFFKNSICGIFKRLLHWRETLPVAPFQYFFSHITQLQHTAMQLKIEVHLITEILSAGHHGTYL